MEPMATGISGTPTTLFSRSSEIANPVMHSALDFFNQPSVSINYEGSFDLEVFPHVRCRGPQLDFFVVAVNKNCKNLNRICLAVEIFIYQPDGSDKLKPADVDLTFANNTLHSLISHVEMFVFGKLTSSSNNNYHHLPFIEIELTADIGFNHTWAPCQGFRYRAIAKSSQEVKEKALEEFRKGDQLKVELYGAPYLDFLDCERLPPPGLTLHLRFYIPPNNCALESVSRWLAADIKKVDQTPYAVVTEEASLFVKNVVLSDCQSRH